MTWQLALIAAYRVIGSLPVLRWPFLGGIIAIICDAGDLFLMDWLGGVANYQSSDKYMDQVYSLAFLLVVLKWQPYLRMIGAGLYGYRMMGFLAFELTGNRALLVLFPNLFEFWFLLVAGLEFGRVERPFSRRWVRALGFLLLVLKLVQEYVLHYARLLDGFTAFHAVSAAWNWLTSFL